MDDTIQAIIVALDERGALLRLGDQQLQWPRHLLPDSIRVGDEVRLQAISLQQAQQQSEHRARRLLAEILGTQR